eukprot:PhM_4_TR18621/c2_g1_i2/m.27199
MISDCPLCGNALDKYIDPISNRKPYCDSNDALDNLLSGSNKNVVLSEVPNVVAQPCAKKKHVPKVTQDHIMSKNNGFTSVINVRRNPNAPKCTTISHALHLAYDGKSRCKEKADIVLKTATDDITFADPLYPQDIQAFFNDVMARAVNRAAAVGYSSSPCTVLYCASVPRVFSNKKWTELCERFDTVHDSYFVPVFDRCEYIDWVYTSMLNGLLDSADGRLIATFVD